MPSALTHAAVGAGLALPTAPRWSVVAAAAALAVAPDLDTVVRKVRHLHHASFFDHRGFFHAPLVLMAAAALAAYLLWRPRWRGPALVCVLAALSHPLLDALTDGGQGVMLLFPFNDARFFFPWRPIPGTAFSRADFWRSVGRILRTEWLFVAAALAAGGTLRWILHSRGKTTCSRVTKA